jgi:glycyl-tRNA synthetase beta chain
MNKQDFLLEIGTEEIPARFIEHARKQLAEKTENWLKEKRIAFEQIRTYATPRRLTVHVTGVAEKQEDMVEELRGPSARIAKTPDGGWSKAAEGFARKNGVSLEQLELREFKGETYVFAVKQIHGEPTWNVLKEHFAEVISQISFPTTMRWNDPKIRFARPVRWLVALLGTEVVPLSWAGLVAGRTTRGHRFLGKEVEISQPADYVETLRQQWVIVDPEERKQRILAQIHKLEQEKGWVIPVDPDLLAEVVYLVEYPTVLYGNFEEEFLEVPKEVLITTMKEHQRYFPVQKENGELLPHFITVRNGDDCHLDLVAKGNEKVLRARLADARFFYEEDQKLPISQALEKLQKVLYQEELGTVAERVRRVAELAEKFSAFVQLTEEEQVILKRSAQICKFDLATQMVGEFPELQGIMGRIYALHAGEKPEVADVIYEHHLPRHAEDELPKSKVAGILSLADKIEAVVASFGIGIQPTGSQDPYGLRRKAAGALQILLQEAYSGFSLSQLIDKTIETLEEAGLVKEERTKLISDLHEFFAQRLRTFMQEEEIRYDVIAAVIGAGIHSPYFMMQKAKVLMNQLPRETFKLEVEGFTRVANLAAKAGEAEVNPALFQEAAEKELYAVYTESADAFARATEANDPAAMYSALCHMVPTIHSFFDKVLVMAKEEEIRNNRLALLKAITSLTRQFAAFEEIVFPS